MNYLSNEKIVDAICVFPVAQQAVGLGSIIINMMKIAKEVFLFLYNTFQYFRTVTSPYRIASPDDWFDLSPARSKVDELNESHHNESSVHQRARIFKEMQDLEERVNICLAYVQDWEPQNTRVANYLDNMKIGFYRTIPGFGTVYSLSQCYNHWQPAEA